MVVVVLGELCRDWSPVDACPLLVCLLRESEPVPGWASPPVPHVFPTGGGVVGAHTSVVEGEGEGRPGGD